MKPHAENLEHASVRQYCKLVRVPAIGANFVSLGRASSSRSHRLMSLQTAIPRRVTLQHCPPPLHRPISIFTPRKESVNVASGQPGNSSLDLNAGSRQTINIQGGPD